MSRVPWHLFKDRQPQAHLMAAVLGAGPTGIDPDPREASGTGRNPRPHPCVYINNPENSIEPFEGAMQRELTPVEGRGGVISGRIVTVLAISVVGAVIALAGVWAIVGMPT
jgi:hypothetical protein